MRRRRPVLLLVYAAIIFLTVKGRGQEVGPGTWEADSLESTAGLVDHPEVEEVLRVLADAGVPPTKEELAGFLTAAEADRRAGVGSRFSVRGNLSFRLGNYQDEGLDKYGKVALSTDWLAVRARIRQFRTGEQEAAGAVEVGNESTEFRVGMVGLSQGYGLLFGAPGRGATLAADSGLKPGRPRLVTWIGSPDYRALSGWGGRVSRGLLSFRFVHGRPARTKEETSGRVSVAQLTGAGRSWQLSLAAMESSGEKGGSLAWSTTSGSISMNVEAMVRGSGQERPWNLAAVGHIGWKGGRGTGVEFQLGFSDMPQGPLMASRPAVLPGWSGRGFALRGYVPAGGGVRVRALVYLGQLPDRTGIRGRESKSLVDFQVARSLGPRVVLGLRYRRSGRDRWEWSTRFPWEAAGLAGQESRGVLTCQVTWEDSGARARLLLRTFDLDRETGGGRRSLMGVSGRLVRGRGWRIRGSWTTAWGEPVDLVSAVSPLTGMVLPRHWGHWRSESILGVERVVRGVRLQAAGSWRVPEPAGTEPGVLTLWIEAGIAW